MSLQLVELGFALLNAGAQHWRNMSSVAVTFGSGGGSLLLPPGSTPSHLVSALDFERCFRARRGNDRSDGPASPT